jgi:hypothetical protein
MNFLQSAFLLDANIKVFYPPSSQTESSKIEK